MITDIFDRFAEHMPLELFVLVGTFMEEVFSPIPSFLVLVPAGAAAESQGMGIWYLAVLMITSGFGRIAGSTILYWFADKFEDFLFGKGRRFFGVSHQQVEQFGQRLGRAGKRDWLLLLTANVLPLFPGGALALTCGFIKINFRMFVVCTFFGTMVNALIYLVIGYAGIKAAEAIEGIELISRVIFAVVIVLVVGWIIRKRRQKTKA